MYHRRFALLRRSSIRLLILLAVLALFAAACSSGGETTTTGGGAETTTGAGAGGELEEVTWALPFLPDTLFVPNEFTTAQGVVVSLAQEGLLAFDDDMNLIPGLAESWEQVDDVTYVYTIREDATFQDGTPVTAADVVASWNYNLNPDNASFVDYFFYSVDTIEATGDREVTVTLGAPDATWQYVPALMAGFVLPASQLEGDTSLLGSPEAIPIGTGPYQVTEFAPGDHVTLERYDGYWGDTGPAQTITITQIPESQTMQLALSDGDIDGTFEISPTEVDQWQALDGVDVVTTPSLGIVLLTMDYDTPPFDDLNVRKAIAHSIDKEGLVAAVLKGAGEKAITVNPPDIWAPVMSADDARAFDASLEQYDFDLDAAAAALAESSVPDGFDFSVQVPGGADLMVNPLLTLQQNLATLGITMNIDEVDDQTWFETYLTHDPDLGMQVMQLAPDFVDPVNYPSLFLSGAQAAPGGYNASNFVDEQVDAQMDVALSSADPAARGAAIEEILQIAQEDVAVIPIYFPDTGMAIRSDLRLDGYNPLYYNIPWAIRGFGTK
jgi:peptide/nickel transport system substrate-binding protein